MYTRPAMTSPTALTSSVGALSLVRYPEAPAFIARRANWSGGCMLSTSYRQRRPLAPQVFQQVHAAHARQRQVQHHDVPLGAAHLAQALFGIRGFADKRGMERPGQDLLDALADDRMIVDEKNTRHCLFARPLHAHRNCNRHCRAAPARAGHRHAAAQTVAPARSCPASQSIRRLKARFFVMPRPLSRIVSVSRLPRSRTLMRTAPACACRATFVSAS